MDLPHRKTCKRYNTPHHAHYLTFSCFKRQPFLSKDRSRQWLADALGRALEKHELTLWAWVIMPEHAHVLVHPRTEDYDISMFLKSVKQPVTNAALKFVRLQTPEFAQRMLDRQPNGTCSHRFWQRGGGYDTNLWTPKFVWDKIQYIHRNPVKRGLVKLSTDWKWSSALDFAHLRHDPPLPVDIQSVPWAPQI